MYQALTGQLYYPLTVFALSLVVGALIELPFTPGYIVAIHLVESVAAYGAVGFVIYTLVRASWESDAAQRFWTLLPIVGKTLSSANAYRWITALRLEHSAGIPMPDAVADAWRASGYIGREDRAQEGQLALREGQELSSLVQKWRQLPRDWVDFIETGEVSGALETAFAHLEREAALGWKHGAKADDRVGAEDHLFFRAARGRRPGLFRRLRPLPAAGRRAHERDQFHPGPVILS